MDLQDPLEGFLETKLENFIFDLLALVFTQSIFEKGAFPTVLGKVQKCLRFCASIWLGSNY